MEWEEIFLNFQYRRIMIYIISLFLFFLDIFDFNKNHKLIRRYPGFIIHVLWDKKSLNIFICFYLLMIWVNMMPIK